MLWIIVNMAGLIFHGNYLYIALFYYTYIAQLKNLRTFLHFWSYTSIFIRKVAISI